MKRVLPLLLLTVVSLAHATGPGMPGGPGQAMVDTDPCPSGWQLAGKLGKAGAFSCRPDRRSAAPPPTEPLACPGGTHYFMDAKHLGCRRLPAGPSKRPSSYGKPVKKGST